MKRLSTVGLILTFLISSVAFSSASAQAATVVSGCQKVKTQVLAYEAKEKDFAAQYAPVNGVWSWFFSAAHLNDYWLLQKKIVDFEVIMFSYNLDVVLANHFGIATTGAVVRTVPVGVLQRAVVAEQN